MSLQAVLSIFTMAICPLISMAFFTLLERKMLGYMQKRKGPNKVSITGIPQPLLDALKLFAKEWTAPMSSNTLLFFFFPSMALTLALILWVTFPSPLTPLIIPFSVMFFLAVSSLNVYTTLGSGWASNSKYALLGALRGIAQTISYEVSMALTLLIILLMMKSLNLNEMTDMGPTLPILSIFPVGMIWLATCLAESNRAPFDFAEGESELVSGFNVEYSGGAFALIFMAEYTSILFLSMMSTLILINPGHNFMVFVTILIMVTSLVAATFIWIRGTLPRMRYDWLMSLTWKGFLPVILMALILTLPMAT